jgi:hypothetical protein
MHENGGEKCLSIVPDMAYEMKGAKWALQRCLM